jgi:hypothetical protein
MRSAKPTLKKLRVMHHLDLFIGKKIIKEIQL